jgi:uroporphyrinogen-III decarboxylase
MNERERLLSVLAREPVDRVPVVSATQTGTVDLMKASGAFWPEAHGDPRKMYELSLAAHTIAGLEGCRVPFEASVDASAFGAVTSLESERRQPAITGRPISSRELADIVTIPNPRRDGRARWYWRRCPCSARGRGTNHRCCAGRYPHSPSPASFGGRRRP